MNAKADGCNALQLLLQKQKTLQKSHFLLVLTQEWQKQPASTEGCGRHRDETSQIPTPGRMCTTPAAQPPLPRSQTSQDGPPVTDQGAACRPSHLAHSSSRAPCGSHWSNHWAPIAASTFLSALSCCVPFLPLSLIPRALLNKCPTCNSPSQSLLPREPDLRWGLTMPRVFTCRNSLHSPHHPGLGIIHPMLQMSNTRLTKATLPINGELPFKFKCVELQRLKFQIFGNIDAFLLPSESKKQAHSS